MEDFSYKEEIRNSRVGCLGSSDARLLSQIASLGYVPKSAHKRLAVVKGLIEHEEIPENAAIHAGNVIEIAIFNHLHSQDERWESNVRWESKAFSTKNCKLISHPDFIKIDVENKVLHVVECKTTKYTHEQTRHMYQEQLYIHTLLAGEKVKELESQYGGKWRTNIALCVYSTLGLDLTQGIEFDPSRISLKSVRISRNQGFDVMLAMQIIDEFLETFNEYYAGEEIDADYLPATVRTQFDNVASMLVEIKEREAKVEEFKQRLYDFMLEKDIKSISCPQFSISRVDPSEAKTFDSKRYTEDLKAKFPRKARKIIEQYTKTTKKKGYCSIKIKKQDEE